MDDIRITRSPKEDEVAALRGRLNDYNIRTTGNTEWEELAAFVHDDDGRLEAGITALVWGGNCEVDVLWVREDRRGGGLGRRLLQAIEEEARALDCRKMFLTTYSFQARPFYEKLGFSVVGEVAEHPRGHSYYLLEKSLD